MPVVAVAGLLALFRVSFAAFTGMIAPGIASRPEGKSHWDDD